MIAAILFIVVAATGCLAALLALLGTGQLALSAADALERDGLPRGKRAPRWAIADEAGTIRRSPPGSGLQLIVFADHSLRSFPSVVDGLRQLAGRGPEAGGPEIVILTRGDAGRSGPALRALGLGDIPVAGGSPALYGKYNVRVMPFAILVDSAGQVRASSLVNHDWQLAKLAQIAAIPLEPAGSPGPLGSAKHALAR